MLRNTIIWGRSLFERKNERLIFLLHFYVFTGSNLDVFSCYLSSFVLRSGCWFQSWWSSLHFSFIKASPQKLPEVVHIEKISKYVKIDHRAIDCKCCAGFPGILFRKEVCWKRRPFLILLADPCTHGQTEFVPSTATQKFCHAVLKAAVGESIFFKACVCACSY